MKTIIHTLCITAAVVASLAFTANPAKANQCIWNGGVYVMKVDWFQADEFYADAQDVLPVFRPAQPAMSATIALGAGTCTNRSERYFAAISVIGCIKAQLSGGQIIACHSPYGVKVQDGVMMKRFSKTAKDEHGVTIAADIRAAEVYRCGSPTFPFCPTEFSPAFKDDRVPQFLFEPSVTHALNFRGTLSNVHWIKGRAIQ